MFLYKRCVLAVSIVAVSTVCNATAVISKMPATARLEQYTGGPVVTWFAGTTCANGILTLKTTDASIVNRYWSMVLAAKTAGSNRMSIQYDKDATDCPLISFFMD